MYICVYKESFLFMIVYFCLQMSNNIYNLLFLFIKNNMSEFIYVEKSKEWFSFPSSGSTEKKFLS